MKSLKKLLCLLMAVCLAASLAFAAFAVDVETENDREILDMTHIDVKESAKYYAEIDGETVVLDAVVVPETIVVTVTTPAADLVYDFGNYKVLTITEKGMTEYRIVLDGTDGALLNAIDWAGASFYMNNVYVSTRLVFEEVPAALAEKMEQDENSNYFVDVSFRYTGIQECTGHNGLRSEGNHGYILGVDLYLSNVPGMKVETPEDPTVPSDPEKPTCPDPSCPSCPSWPTCPDPSCPSCPSWPTCPDPSCPSCPSWPTCPDPSNPSNPSNPSDPQDPSNPSKPSDPQDPSNPSKPSDPQDPTNPSNPSNPSDPQDPTNPSNPSDPQDPSNPSNPSDPQDPSNPTDPSDPVKPTAPSEPEPDDVPDTGDNSKLVPLVILMAVSAVGMGATAIIGKKLKYIGKWE